MHWDGVLGCLLVWESGPSGPVAQSPTQLPYFECFPGARQPASQPGGGGGRGGGFQSLPATQPRLGAAPTHTLTHMLCQMDGHPSTTQLEDFLAKLYVPENLHCAGVSPKSLHYN